MSDNLTFTEEIERDERDGQTHYRLVVRDDNHVVGDLLRDWTTAQTTEPFEVALVARGAFLSIAFTRSRDIGMTILKHLVMSPVDRCDAAAQSERRYEVAYFARGPTEEPT